jgi:predicted transposase/invertase (TIGR01784 family)
LKTDTIFYRIMQTAPGILFELLGEPAELARNYEFRAVEIKQLAFRLDGIFLPKPNAENQTVTFVEVQFQDDPRFYQRFFGEIFLFLAQHPETVNWRAVVLFSDRRIEPVTLPQ